MKIISLLFMVLSLNAFADKTSFSNSEIIFPKGKSDIEKFLNLLKDPGNKAVVGLNDGPVKFTEIPTEKSAIFWTESSSYMLYQDDFNNDGRPEYFVIYINSGSGNYSGVQGAYTLEGAKLKSLHFSETVVSNLFPGKDMSRFHPFLAKPFAVTENGKIYLRFQDQSSAKKVFVYLWKQDKFSLVDLP